MAPDRASREIIPDSAHLPLPPYKMVPEQFDIYSSNLAHIRAVALLKKMDEARKEDARQEYLNRIRQFADATKPLLKH